MRNPRGHDDHAVFLQEVLVDQGVLLNNTSRDAGAMETHDLLPRRDENGARGPHLCQIYGADAVGFCVYKFCGLVLTFFKNDWISQNLPESPESTRNGVADAGVDLADFCVRGIVEIEAKSNIVLETELDKKRTVKMSLLLEVFVQLLD